MGPSFKGIIRPSPVKMEVFDGIIFEDLIIAFGFVSSISRFVVSTNVKSDSSRLADFISGDRVVGALLQEKGYGFGTLVVLDDLIFRIFIFSAFPVSGANPAPGSDPVIDDVSFNQGKGPIARRFAFQFEADNQVREILGARMTKVAGGETDRVVVPRLVDDGLDLPPGHRRIDFNDGRPEIDRRA